ncbi:Hermansky-Pudlak syndrome 4 protein [Dunckerocampus dactyliophorus]|uniref:Hermansky-Pudlak syndrome 4 protein n=1 Tax=Dunckerocampus dactyliophorus TaxID=161453 RepID=UPI0024071692|nr:Hermansky-Pudlak syndrome 4 protein [Dunckerocampus dactyliophorus]XP_054629934.1 Hermansky-Pudlak syndrome 4 protein [Dunckerocampus dactyliophorus]XP_054629935.1 Hermansky-Pudlak syndrome 4 protein [Dunckerocampus dactyliophorus]XP_054629936.1 Hermansky-Pudlak syndrome 4 protein [Dunckerocampus dactyliophorus]XP_054629938.1 Hermansky-Pudlak syndrome 4 protein [Dunckerocampus dactyliophorus]XP_054629939.1 Hermansky-Pudlak syndrome 4 protein [Dunckerocampus dactyliophorus]XP_054629940.1 He
MAELIPSESRGCHYFFLYDGSKVRGEGDPTKEGICYFYPEETPVDKQELLCGQLAGVSRCISELSSSAVRLVRLRRIKFAIHMQDDFFWALGCSMDIPTVSVCQLLHKLINLFCFYNGSVRQSYQLHSHETLASQWSQYLSHVLAGPSELHHVFSSLITIDSTNVDPLLLLKAALILQACQRCPLVLAGCILFRGRVVSTQMPPDLTMKVMVHESVTYKTQSPKGQSPPSSFGDAVSSRAVFLTIFELQYLQSAPLDEHLRLYSTPIKDHPPHKSRLSRTLSDTASSESVPSDPTVSQKAPWSPRSSTSDDSAQATADPLLPRPPLSNGEGSNEDEEEVVETFHSSGGQPGGSELNTTTQLTGVDGSVCCGTVFDTRGTEFSNEESQGNIVEGVRGNQTADHNPLIPMTLYLHRVEGLVLALLVEPHFLCDKAAMEEVYHSCLASLNGLEAHLRSIVPGAPGSTGPYIFAHFDCALSTLRTNLSGQPGGGPERSFVKATSLLHSHFCNTETLQEAIIRNATTAVYGTRSVAQETYFLHHGAALKNSGIPNHQDSAFSLPGKTRHRLLKHGVNLL